MNERDPLARHQLGELTITRTAAERLGLLERVREKVGLERVREDVGNLSKVARLQRAASDI